MELWSSVLFFDVGLDNIIITIYYPGSESNSSNYDPDKYGEFTLAP